MAATQTTGTFGVFSADANLLSATLAENWWVVALRGALGIVFAIIAFTVPGAAMLALVFVFAAYALVGGALAIAAVVRASGAHRPWGLLVVEGLAGILAGAAAVLWPGLTVTVFVLLVAAWALVSGILMLGASFDLKRDHGRAWLALGGAVSVVYGLLLMVAPALGALVLTWWLGAYALVFGVALLALSFRLQAKKSSQPAKMEESSAS